jgi:hypothetical protein
MTACDPQGKREGQFLNLTNIERDTFRFFRRKGRTVWSILIVLATGLTVLPCRGQSEPSPPQLGSFEIENESPRVLYEMVGKFFDVSVQFAPGMRSDNKFSLTLSNSTLGAALNQIAGLTRTAWVQTGPNAVYVSDALPPAIASPNRNSAPYKFRKFTADFGGGWTRSQGGGLETGINFRAGGGWLLSPQPHLYSASGDPLRGRHWSLYLVGEFAFTQSGLTNTALLQQIQLNPALSSATSATPRYYSATADPTFRYCLLKCRVTFYELGGFGWMHRTVEFDGPSNGTSPVGSNGKLASFGYQSPAYEAGSGVTFGPFPFSEGVTYYVEWRRLQGLGSNGGSTLWPLSFGIRW